jgi:hypothetical protein
MEPWAAMGRKIFSLTWGASWSYQEFPNLWSQHNSCLYELMDADGTVDE